MTIRTAYSHYKHNTKTQPLRIKTTRKQNNGKKKIWFFTYRFEMFTCCAPVSFSFPFRNFPFPTQTQHENEMHNYWCVFVFKNSIVVVVGVYVFDFPFIFMSVDINLHLASTAILFQSQLLLNFSGPEFRSIWFTKCFECTLGNHRICERQQ